MKFNRSILSVVGVISWPIILFCGIVISDAIKKFIIHEDKLTPTDAKILVIAVFIFVVCLIAIFIIVPPDFKYFINIADDCIIFEMNENDHRRIGRDFKIVSKKMHYIILDDGFSRIRIAYNRKVLQFLEEINK